MGMTKRRVRKRNRSAELVTDEPVATQMDSDCRVGPNDVENPVARLDTLAGVAMEYGVEVTNGSNQNHSHGPSRGCGDGQDGGEAGQGHRAGRGTGGKTAIVGASQGRGASKGIGHRTANGGAGRGRGVNPQAGERTPSGGAGQGRETCEGASDRPDIGGADLGRGATGGTGDGIAIGGADLGRGASGGTSNGIASGGAGQGPDAFQGTSDRTAGGGDGDDDTLHLSSGSDGEEDAASEEASGRGPNLSHEKIFLAVHGSDLFHHRTGRCLDPSMPRQMSLAMKRRMNGCYPNWTVVPTAVRELMCQEWVGKYDFYEDEIPKARRAFYTSASQRMRSIMHNARKRALKLCSASSLSECLEFGRPTWLSYTIWKRLILYHWATEDYMAICEKARQSRNTPVNGVSSRHTGGSVPFEVSEQKLSAKKKRPVSFVEVFNHTHKLPSGEFADHRSAMASEAYTAAMIEKYGQNVETWPYIDEEIYLRTIGKPKRGRYYGLGSSGVGRFSMPSKQSARMEFGAPSNCGGQDPLLRVGGVYDTMDGQLADMQKRMEETAGQIRDEILEQFQNTNSTADPALIKEAMHQAMEMEMHAFRTEVQTAMNRLFKEAEDRQRKERERERERRERELVDRDDRLVRKIMAALHSEKAIDERAAGGPSSALESNGQAPSDAS